MADATFTPLMASHSVQ